MTVSCETCGKDFGKDNGNARMRKLAIKKLANHLIDFHKEAVGIRVRTIY